MKPLLEHIQENIKNMTEGFFSRRKENPWQHMIDNNINIGKLNRNKFKAKVTFNTEATNNASYEQGTRPAGHELNSFINSVAKMYIDDNLALRDVKNSINDEEKKIIRRLKINIEKDRIKEINIGLLRLTSSEIHIAVLLEMDKISITFIATMPIDGNFYVAPGMTSVNEI